MNSTVAKVSGWMQFAAQLASQMASTGLPHNTVGWVSLVGSLIVAIGMHAAGSTNGTT
jgi:hypothetical protein